MSGVMTRTKSTPAMGKLKQLTKQVSRTMVRSDPETLLPEEKYSLSESTIDEGEFTWNVKVKSSDGSMKLERTLVIGPKGCRLHLPISLEELDNIPYQRMKEFSYNADHHVFQISWQQAGSKSLEIIYFHTKHCVEIHETIQKFLKDILRTKKSGDPDDIMARCTYLRPVNIDELKKGGRFRTEEPVEIESPSNSRTAPGRSMSVQPARIQHVPKKKEDGLDQPPRKRNDREKQVQPKPTMSSKSQSPKSTQSKSTQSKSTQSPNSTRSPKPHKSATGSPDGDDRRNHHTKQKASSPRSRQKEKEPTEELSEISSSSDDPKPAKKRQGHRDPTHTSKKDTNITYKLNRDRDNIERAKNPPKKNPFQLIDIGEENNEHYNGSYI